MPVHQSALKAFLDSNPSALVGRGATEQEIVAAERQLGASFPKAFRSYLGECGYLEYGSAEFYGLGLAFPSTSNWFAGRSRSAHSFTLTFPYTWFHSWPTAVETTIALI
jgi:hypothetical protein